MISSTGGGTAVPVITATGQYRHPTWSPDRTMIAFAQGPNATANYDIYLLDLTDPSATPQNITNLDALAEFWHPEIDWRAIKGAVDDVGVMHGREAVRAYVQGWISTFADLRNEPEELINAGDQIVAVQPVSGRARLSGVETELRYAVVYTVRDGKIASGREYLTREEALEAAGLEE